VGQLNILVIILFLFFYGQFSGPFDRCN